jgi:hypothetical protein
MYSATEGSRCFSSYSEEFKISVHGDSLSREVLVGLYQLVRYTCANVLGMTVG